MPPTSVSLTSILLASALVIVCVVVASPAALAQQPSPTPFEKILTQAKAETENKRWDAAIPLWEQVLKANPVVGDFWLQFGDALYGAKDYYRAIPAYQKAFELGAGRPYNSAYAIACAYALLGDKVQALVWLEKSLATGFQDLQAARTDSDLQSLRDEARFQQLVAGKDVSKMSRDDGWRYDLGLLASEIKRLAKDPFVITSERNFDATVTSLLKRIPQLSDVQIDIEMRKLVALLGRSHSILLNGRPDRNSFQPLPFQTYFFEEGLFIIAADAKQKDLVGAQILLFGDKTPDELLNALNPLISQTNKYRALRVAPELLRGTNLLHALGLIPDKDKVVLSIRSLDGKTRTLTVNTDPTLPGYGDLPPTSWTTLEQLAPGQLPLYLKDRKTNLWFEHEPKTQMMYLAVNSLRNDPRQPPREIYARLFNEIDERAVDKFVIDLRWCNGGDTANALPLLYEIIRRDKINQRGKLFVVIGRQTFSAAMNLASFLERHTNAIFVGEPTGDSPNFVGETTIVTLPYSKSRAIISDRYWQSSNPTDVRKWIAPMLYAPPKFVEYRINRDPALEAILSFQ